MNPFVPSSTTAPRGSIRVNCHEPAYAEAGLQIQRGLAASMNQCSASRKENSDATRERLNFTLQLMEDGCTYVEAITNRVRRVTFHLELEINQVKLIQVHIYVSETMKERDHLLTAIRGETYELTPESSADARLPEIPVGVQQQKLKFEEAVRALRNVEEAVVKLADEAKLVDRNKPQELTANDLERVRSVDSLFHEMQALILKAESQANRIEQMNVPLKIRSLGESLSQRGQPTSPEEGHSGNPRSRETRASARNGIHHH